MNLKKISLTLVSLLLLNGCFEQNGNEVAKQDFTKVDFRESAQKEVLQDSYIARLKISQKGMDKVQIQKEINDKMALALKLAKEIKELRVKTGNYSVQQNWDRIEKKYHGYNASQEIIIDGKNKKELLQISGKIQALGFSMSSLNSYLSDEKRASYRDELVIEALKRVQESSKLIAKNIGKDEIFIANINISQGNNYSPRNVMMSSASMEMAKDANFTNPNLEAGYEKISVTINATTHLKD